MANLRATGSDAFADIADVWFEKPWQIWERIIVIGAVTSIFWFLLFYSPK
jgi:hypothetical protein